MPLSISRARRYSRSSTGSRTGWCLLAGGNCGATIRGRTGTGDCRQHVPRASIRRTRRRGASEMAIRSRAGANRSGGGVIGQNAAGSGERTAWIWPQRSERQRQRCYRRRPDRCAVGRDLFQRCAGERDETRRRHDAVMWLPPASLDGGRLDAGIQPPRCTCC